MEQPSLTSSKPVSCGNFVTNHCLLQAVMFLELIPANTEDELRLNTKRLYTLYILNMNKLIIALLFNTVRIALNGL